jgi:GGDEF domain-containing protein
MISIQQNLSELEKSHQLRTTVLDCYLGAIENMARYAVDLDAAITAPHSKHLADLAAGLVDASAEELAESRGTLRGLLRDYRDRAAKFLGDLRKQLSNTAQALREMVEGLSQSDADHHDKLCNALVRLREAANSAEGSAVRAVVGAAADSIALSLDQMRKQHQLTVVHLQTELRLLHNRIDSLETKVTNDEVTKFSNRRFMAEYLGAIPAEGACLLILKIRGLAEARARFGAAIADDVVATFGRRLRNAVPRDAVVGRWSEQDFLAVAAPGKAAGGLPVKQVAEHLSMPYACMIGGKVVRIPLAVTAESLVAGPGATPEELHARVAEAFQ